MDPGDGTVAILGASPKPARYAFRALHLLREHGYRVLPINPAFAKVEGERCYSSITETPKPIHTVTMYLGEGRSLPLLEEIIAAKPKRIIMNPGAENATLAQRAHAAGIEVVEDCTLVMLKTGTF